MLLVEANDNQKHAMWDAVVTELMATPVGRGLLDCCLNRLRTGPRDENRSVSNMVWFAQFENYWKQQEIAKRRESLQAIE